MDREDDDANIHSPRRTNRIQNPRAGWDKIMEAAVREFGNELSQEDLDWLNMPTANDFDEKEWTW